ncbi:SDR family oxidoreductase [Mycobacterium sp. IDR2000157661]|uniref:SDR family oxidoreductase n=1 Tax=Mycobacterium sp. IDR2000157661 TaxID=2867005 RepID=UPI001EEEB569|nr:SDR family oxidoreductase [Mycobacterium sp. IDR2000157661]ULE35403.1 SDR family oxidoreductase [Mycobacterium sp. IDR2000157661]
MRPTPARIALVTGGSRGIGADVARLLADDDTHIIVNYRERADDAESIAGAIRDAGGHASTIRADISDDLESRAMIDAIAARFGRLDALILNTSGGLPAGADPGQAMRLNRDGQRRLALMAVPLMPVGGRIVFVTSHQAHFFPTKAVPKGYTAVAASRRAGETALYAMRAEFDRAGVHFSVVSGDMADGTFAGAIVNAANALNPSRMVFVGRADYLMTA